MKLLSPIIIITAFATGTAAFQPAAKKALRKSGNSQTTAPPSITKNEMVAIRSPFWNAFDRGSSSSVRGISTGDYVVDRDYSVASILIIVGIWLSMFGPSE